VLFLEPMLDAETKQGLREGTLAQFALIGAELVFQSGVSPGSLAEQMASARALAAQQGAIAVFWIESQDDGTWLVHMMDSERERVVIRPVDAAGERRTSAIEAVAVMVRESTRALIENEPPPEPKPPTPSPAPNPAAPRQDLRPLRLWVDYSLDDFAPEVTWQHGLGLGVAWQGTRPWYLGLGLLITAPMDPPAPLAITVQRYPIAAVLGYRYRAGLFSLDGELGVSADLLRRSAATRQADDGSFHVTAEPAESSVLLAVAPRIRGEVQPWPAWGFFAVLGMDILLNPFSYISKMDTRRTSLLRPRPIRPVAEIGVAFYP
jgi:hypothetical protein